MAASSPRKVVKIKAINSSLHRSQNSRSSEKIRRVNNSRSATESRYTFSSDCLATNRFTRVRTNRRKSLARSGFDAHRGNPQTSPGGNTLYSWICFKSSQSSNPFSRSFLKSSPSKRLTRLSSVGIPSCNSASLKQYLAKP